MKPFKCKTNTERPFMNVIRKGRELKLSIRNISI